MASGDSETASWQDVLFERLKMGRIRQMPYVPDAGHARVIRRALQDPEGVDDIKARLTRRQGPGFASVLISTGEDAPRVLPPRDGVELKNRFRRQLGLPTI